MQEGPPTRQIQHVSNGLSPALQCQPLDRRIEYGCWRLHGVHREFDHRDFDMLEGGREVMRITQPFQNLTRRTNSSLKDTIVALAADVKTAARKGHCRGPVRSNRANKSFRRGKAPNQAQKICEAEPSNSGILLTLSRHGGTGLKAHARRPRKNSAFPPSAK